MARLVPHLGGTSCPHFGPAIPSPMVGDCAWGTRFQALRTAQGVTRAFVERKTGVTARTVRLIEEGRANPARGTRIVLLQLFGLTELPHIGAQKRIDTQGS